MIKAILIFNNHGKPRLNKFYHYYVSSAIFLELFLNKVCIFRMNPNSSKLSKKPSSWSPKGTTMFATSWRVGAL